MPVPLGIRRTWAGNLLWYSPRPSPVGNCLARHYLLTMAAISTGQPWRKYCLRKRCRFRCSRARNGREASRRGSVPTAEMPKKTGCYLSVQHPRAEDTGVERSRKLRKNRELLAAAVQISVHSWKAPLILAILSRVQSIQSSLRSLPLGPGFRQLSVLA